MDRKTIEYNLRKLFISQTLKYTQQICICTVRRTNHVEIQVGFKWFDFNEMYIIHT